jgi:hypothetical protein
MTAESSHSQPDRGLIDGRNKELAICAVSPRRSSLGERKGRDLSPLSGTPAASGHTSKLPLFPLARKFFSPARRVKYNHVSLSKVQKNTLEKRLIDFIRKLALLAATL